MPSRPTRPRLAAWACLVSGPGAGGVEVTQLTRQLAQIDLNTVTRDLDSLLTPANKGRTLTGKPTFRRAAQDKEPRFPAHEIVMRPRQGDGPALTVRFGE